MLLSIYGVDVDLDGSPTDGDSCSLLDKEGRMGRDRGDQ
jgi:hypothetical protein